MSLLYFHFPLFLLINTLLPLGCSERTLCERRLGAVPSGLFYYQRVESDSAVRCAERCVDEWEFCRSALLVEDVKQKTMCQLYAHSFESRIPLEVPPLSSVHTDPNRLLPITLIELTNPPCSTKFSSQSTILDQISGRTREQLRMLPGVDEKRLELDAFQGKNSAMDGRREPLGKEPRWKVEGGEQEESGKRTKMWEEVSDAYQLAPWPSSSASSGIRPSPPLLSSKYAIDQLHQFRQHIPAIRPMAVSRGQYQQFVPGCPDGICPTNIAAHQHAPATSADEGEKAPCPAIKSSDPCAPKAQWTEWTEWSRCSESCGGGQRARQRVCRNGRNCTGPALKTQQCNEQKCPSWAKWGAWEECSVTCGPGTQRRVRECEPLGAQCRGGAGTERRECELRSCPQWGPWGAWTECTKSCGSGESVRHRECRNSASPSECRGPSTERVLCNTQQCPAWTPWSEWGACSKSCGTGATRTRTRQCRYKGLISDQCPGSIEEAKECKFEACPYWTEWTTWSHCSTSCGHGQQTRSRECLPKGQGCQGAVKELRACKKAVCPYFDQWSEWGGCSVTYGQGFCERKRKCIKGNNIGKKTSPKPFPMREKMMEENTSDEGKQDGGDKGTQMIISPKRNKIQHQILEVAQSAAVVVRRSPMISAKLELLDDEEEGEKEDERGDDQGPETRISYEPEEGKQVADGECVGPDVQRKACDAGPCCTWSEWSPWSGCIVQCASAGYRERTRRCEMIGAGENEKETRPPSPFARLPSAFSQRLPFNGLVSPFSSARCGVCKGESRQTESCALPGAKKSCEEGMDGEPIRAKPSRMGKAEQMREEEEGDEGRVERKKPELAGKDEDELGGRGKTGKKPDLVGREEEEEDDDDDDYEPNGRRQNQSGDGRLIGTEAVGKECGEWSPWSGWSDCGGPDCQRRRSRRCHSKDNSRSICQCEGNSEEVANCARGECEQIPKPAGEGIESGEGGPNVVDETLDLDDSNGSLGPDTYSLPRLPSKTDSSSSSIIKSVQLTPRNETDGMSGGRGGQQGEYGTRKRGGEGPEAGDEEEPKQVGESREQCEWSPWSEWGPCSAGHCELQQGQRTRRRHCTCDSGCAGIADETISCTVSNC